MINVTYTQNGEAVVDGLLETWANAVIGRSHTRPDIDINISVGCGSMIDMLRVLIKRDTISVNEINFYTTEGIRVGPDSEGCLEWHIGFADKQDKLLDELLGI